MQHTSIFLTPVVPSLPFPFCKGEDRNILGMIGIVILILATQLSFSHFIRQHSVLTSHMWWYTPVTPALRMLRSI
jgi:hypothetical protein